MEAAPERRPRPEPAFDPEAFYAQHPLRLPAAAGRFAWAVTTASGQIEHVHSDDLPGGTLGGRLLALRPHQIAYHAHDRLHRGRFFVVPLFFDSRAQLDLAARILRDEFGVSPSGLEASRAGARHQLVVSAPPFTDAPLARVARLAAAFTPQGFRPPADRPRTSAQIRYQAVLHDVLDAWGAMEPVQLHAHLKAKTPLGGEGDRVRDFLAAPGPALARLPAYPRLYAHLHRVALEATFPAPDARRLLRDGRVLLPGSWDERGRGRIEPLSLLLDGA